MKYNWFVVVGGVSRFVFMERIATQNKKILVKVVYVEEKFQTTLQMDPAFKIKDIYPKIAVKVKVSNFLLEVLIWKENQRQVS